MYAGFILALMAVYQGSWIVCVIWLAFAIYNGWRSIKSMKADNKYSGADSEIEIHKLEIATSTVQILGEIKEQLEAIEKRLPKPRKRVTPKKK
jgi:hypothetical protein